MKTSQYDMKNNMSRFMDIIILQLSKDGKYAQVSINESIKRYGEEARVAVLKTLSNYASAIHLIRKL